MNILTTELEYQRTFHIVPNIWVNLGKSFGITLSWLNFRAIAKHISTDWHDQSIYFYSPFVTLHSYPDSAYRLTFELSFLDYTFRRGIWRIDGEEPIPVDNTPGFVTSEWFAQFRKEHDIAEELDKMLDGINDMLEKHKEELEKKNRQN